RYLATHVLVIFCFDVVRYPLCLLSVPTRRSSDLHGELAGDDGGTAAVAILEDFEEIVAGLVIERLKAPVIKDQEVNAAQGPLQPDRKSTRLNSSHVKISYAVFCLKKKHDNSDCNN